ncbi:MAG: hypothetical protein KatS3mg016_0450 [Fimbriimonadales bacterium]|nr:MAG: hypothetical protein KatS3mg016_0450 [Fimbriimonadales bacterium]GIW61028.1 MAG: hypothetical protein KatS3mg087_2094 [Patescibacteria group bacterium]
MHEDLANPHWWSNAWLKHYRRYMSQPSYQAYYLYCVLPKGVGTILELGAGSFRDVAQLNKWGYHCIGTDFATQAVEIARKLYPRWAQCFQVEDATALSFGSEMFDLSYHNGLLVCFNDNSMIERILQEQRRVTRRWMVCTVHNALNSSLKCQFAEKAKHDPLYQIRFFEPDEITELMRSLCSRIDLYPFGSLWCNRLIKYSRNRFLVRWYYRLTYRIWQWETCERIMAVGWLE